MWVDTLLPEDIVDILARDVSDFYEEAQTASIMGDGSPGSDYNPVMRSSRTAWIPESHWSAGFIMHYANMVNESNFGYDLTGIDGKQLQYGIYGVGGHYSWHKDYGIGNCCQPDDDRRHGVHEKRIGVRAKTDGELVRKLSFSLQLTNADDYEGGNLEIVDDCQRVTAAPKKKGTIVFFDSRTVHRVSPVTKGERRSIVGWLVGPRWK